VKNLNANGWNGNIDCIPNCNDLKNFINKTALINLENQYAAIKATR